MLKNINKNVRTVYASLLWVVKCVTNVNRKILFVSSLVRICHMFTLWLFLNVIALFLLGIVLISFYQK